MSVWVNVRRNSHRQTRRPRRDVQQMWRNVLKLEKNRAQLPSGGLGEGSMRCTEAFAGARGSRAAMNGMRRRLRKRLASRRSAECAGRRLRGAAACAASRGHSRRLSRPPSPPRPRLRRAPACPRRPRVARPPRNNSPLEPRNARSISIGTCSTSALTLIQIPDREIC